MTGNSELHLYNARGRGRDDSTPEAEKESNAKSAERIQLDIDQLEKVCNPFALLFVDFGEIFRCSSTAFLRHAGESTCCVTLATRMRRRGSTYVVSLDLHSH